MTAQIGVVRQTRLLRQSGPVFAQTFGTVYVGPGNVISGALAWYGLRAYSKATAATKAINIRASGDNATTDINTLSNGNLDVATINSFLTTHGGNAFVTKIYDQTGGGFDLSQTTAANQPQLNLTGIGSLPTVDFNISNSDTLTRTTAPAQAQPVTFSIVAKSVNSASQQSLLLTPSTVQVGYNAAGNNTAFAFAGSAFSATASDGSFHAIQAIFNSTTSALVIDGSSTTGNASTNNLSSGTMAIGSTGASLQFFNGSIAEIGIWPVGFTAAQSSNMNTNQHNYWGF